jgi:hypothetical protein
MYLQKGMWQGRQVVPAGWIAEASSIHSDNGDPQSGSDWTQGYGYQFWRCRHDAYRGDGAFGQFCVVMPQQDAVLAITSGVRDMQAVLDKLWQHLLPAMGPQPLPANAQAQGELCARLQSLSLPLSLPLPLSQGQATPLQSQPGLGKRYTLERNALSLESVELAPGAEGVTLVVRDARGEHHVPLGSGEWRRSRSDLRGRGEEPVAASGAWTAQDTYEVRICCYASEICFVLRFAFAGDDLGLEFDPNVSWGEPLVTAIHGRTRG